MKVKKPQTSKADKNIRTIQEKLTSGRYPTCEFLVAASRTFEPLKNDTDEPEVKINLKNIKKYIFELPSF